MHRLKQITVREIEQFYLVHSTPNHKYAVSCRPNYGLSFSAEGHITYYYSGKQIRTNPGDVILLPQGAEYHLRGEVKGDFGVINFTINDDVRIQDFLIIPTRSPDWYMHTFEKMKALSLFPQKRLQLMRMMYELLEKLSEEQHLQASPLSQILGYLETSYTDWALTNQTLADRAHISEVYLRQLFQRELGISPKQYILNLRLKKARQMLCDEKHSIAEIARSCGFSSIYHFSRAFHKAIGYSPTEYRHIYGFGLF